MTMNAKKLMMYGLVVLLGGCVPILSLQPLFTKESLTFDEKLLGTWVEDVNKPEAAWGFTRLSDSEAEGLPPSFRSEVNRFYHLSLSDNEGRKGSLVACLVKLQDRLFLDAFPDKFPSGERDPDKMKLAFNAYFFLPAHMFARVDALGDQLKLRLTNDDEFEKLVEAEPGVVQFTTVEDRPLLTASTQELQAFVLKHAADDRLFPGEITLTRQTK
jgi:hypothetical protein